MSFFEFGHSDLERGKRRFGGSDFQTSGDVAAYNWAEEGYDGLGDLLQEGGDELNDETFGNLGPVGKDFDFSNPALPGLSRPLREEKLDAEAEQTRVTAAESPRPTAPSLEAIWDDKSPFSVLPKANGAARSAIGDSRTSPLSSLITSHAESGGSLQQPVFHNSSQNGIRTLREIESEMYIAAQESRLMAQHQHLLRQQQEYQRQLLMQRTLRQHQTPSPRAVQSPRFLDYQRHLQQQESYLTDELERQLARTRIQHIHSPGPYVNQPQAANASLSDMHTSFAFQAHRQQSKSPALFVTREQEPVHLQNIQLQQRLLSEMAQAEFLRDMQGVPSQPEQETLRVEAMRKILEAEKMEEKRRRKAAKIAHMARYNDLMTQSDKDFITRIQVSQLVTQDPYSDDFYAQVYGAILRTKMGIQSQDEHVLKFSSGGGVGLGLTQKMGNRRPSAMLRMEQQVERIVSNARKREEEKGLHSLQSLQGALGRTSGRSYKAAPRQLLQVETGNLSGYPNNTTTSGHSLREGTLANNASAAKEAAKLGREALGSTDTGSHIKREPLSHRQALVALEALYDLVLRAEGLKRSEPPLEEGEESASKWKKEYEEVVDMLWNGLQVMVPLEASNPHPFVSLLIPNKGKKILPRVTRHLSHSRMFTLLTLLVACFDQLDVVKNAYLLDFAEETRERMEAERQSDAFLLCVLHSILPVVARADLRLVTGLLGLLLDRTNVVLVAQSSAGVALLTLFLSRVEVIKQAISSGLEPNEIPTPEEARQWQLMFDHLFQLLAPHLNSLFPSTRMASPGQSKQADQADQPVWQLLAAVALHAVTEQQHILVATLREKILENVLSVNKGWVATEDERRMKLANINLFLHALGLDSSQITL